MEWGGHHPELYSLAFLAAMLPVCAIIDWALFRESINFNGFKGLLAVVLGQYTGLKVKQRQGRIQ